MEERLELGQKNWFLPLNHAEMSKHQSIYIFNKLKRNSCKGSQKEKSFLKQSLLLLPSLLFFKKSIRFLFLSQWDLSHFYTFIGSLGFLWEGPVRDLSFSGCDYRAGLHPLLEVKWLSAQPSSPGSSRSLSSPGVCI